MDSIVKSFLEKEMLVAPEIYSQLKGKESEVDGIIGSINYSLVVSSLEPRQLEEVKEEIVKKPTTNNKVFGKFITNEKPKTVEEVGNSNSLVQAQAKPEEKKEEIVKSEPKTEEPSYNHNINLLKVFNSNDSKKSVDDFIKASNQRYEFLRGLLAEKMELQNLTSINKIGDYSEVSIIGVVKSIDKKERMVLEVEDSTASVKILLETNDHRFLVGDVVGFNGVMKKEYFVPKKIVFPDVPIKRSIVTSNNETTVMFCGKISPDRMDDIIKVAGDNKANYLILTGDPGDLDKIKNKIPAWLKFLYSPIYLFAEGNEPYIGPSFGSDRIVSLSSPSLVSVEGVTILVYNGSSYENLPRNDDGILEILKRRYVPLSLSSENFLLDVVPDVVYSSLDRTVVKNYKGNTLVSVDDANAVLINLKTRESKTVSLVSK